MRTVGIDIGSYSIKVVEVESHLKSVVLRDFYELPLNHEPGQDVSLERLEILKRIAAQYDPRQNRIIVGLGSEHSTQRVLTFPFLERRKILQSLPFELEDVIPFSQADAVFDFRIIEQKANTTRVLAVAVPKKYIQEILLLCETAGLDPDIVSLDGFGLSNLFENISAPPKVFEGGGVPEAPAELVVYIGYSKTLINVMQDKRLISSRAIFFGGKDLTNAVSRTYQLPYLEALKGVNEKGFILTSPEGANEDQVAFSNVIAQGLSSLLNELQRTVVDLKAEMKISFRQGYLMGGMSRLINLCPYLAERLDVPFQVHYHLNEMAKRSIGATDEQEKVCGVAVGLALEGLRKPKNPAINLRKGLFSKQSQKFKFFWEQYRQVVSLSAALFVIFFIYSVLRVGFTEDSLEAVEKVIQDQSKNSSLGITKSQLKPEALRKFIKNKREELESKKEVVRLNGMVSALDVMRSISQAAPPKGQITLDISHFNLDGENLILEGTVVSSAEFELLKRQLGQNSLVTQVKTGPAPPASPGKFPFQVSMHLTRLPDRKAK